MAIDCTFYSAQKSIYINRKGWCCVYVVSHVSGLPTKIGVTSDIRTQISRLTSSNYEKLEVKFILWTAGKAAAARIESATRKQFDEYLIHGEWFSIHYDCIHDYIRKTAQSLYPSLRFFTHEQMVALLGTKHIDKVENLGLSSGMRKLLGEPYL